ncbi:MAG: hypothetical protein FP814_11595 [Desulfobacterium sp.]|nr:hypothetical protein [Desulfobacterium sp.]
MIRDLSRKLRVRSILSYGQKVDPVSGDQETFVDTHKVHVTADEIMLQDNGGAPYRAAMVDVIVDIVNDLDTGTKSPNTWYHIWIISNPGGLVKGLLSTSSSNPSLPAGYIFKAYVGAIYNNGGNYLVSYYQNDKLAWAEQTYPLAMTAFPSIPTRVDLASSVPSTAISVILEVSGLTAIGGNYISNVFVGPTSSGPWHNRWMMVVGTQQDTGGIDHVQFLTQCEIIIDSAQEIYAYVGTPNDRLEIHVLGWRY